MYQLSGVAIPHAAYGVAGTGDYVAVILGPVDHYGVEGISSERRGFRFWLMWVSV